MARLVQPPDLGDTGTVDVMAVEFTYHDAGTPFTFTELPAYIEVTRMSLVVHEEFDSGTSDLLDVGDGTDADAYSANGETDLTTAGYQTIAGAGATGVPTWLSSATTITGTYASSGTEPTQGKARLLVEFVRLNP